MKPATTPAPPRRLRADAARNQERIVAAASELFADHGLEITLDDVAERAGVGVGTVYRRFANKKELIADVFERNVTEFAEAAEAAIQTLDPWQGLIEFFEYAATHLATNRGFSEVMLDMQDEDMQRFALVRDRIKPNVAAIVDRARDAGLVQPEVEASDFFAMIHMIDALAAFTRPVNPNTWRRYMALVLNGVRTDAAPRQPLTEPALTDDEVECAKAFTCMGRKR